MAATGVCNKPVLASLTIQNSLSVAVSCTAVEPYVYINGTTSRAVAATVGKVSGLPKTVPATGTDLVVEFEVVFHKPTIDTESTLVYGVAATITTSDGATTTATADTITISGLDLDD